jgi:hypothetical protein
VNEKNDHNIVLFWEKTCIFPKITIITSAPEWAKFCRLGDWICTYVPTYFGPVFENYTVAHVSQKYNLTLCRFGVILGHFWNIGWSFHNTSGHPVWLHYILSEIPPPPSW